MKNRSVLWLFLLLSTALFSSGKAAASNCCYDPCASYDECNFWDGMYGGVSGGANFLHASSKDHMKLDADVGYAVGFQLGYRFCQGIRAEFEGVYRYNKIDHISFLGAHIDSDGHVRSMSYMANALYEIPFNWCGLCLFPYLGGGIGYTHQKIKATDFDLAVEGTRSGFAWQVIGGVGYWITSNWDVGVEYRYFKGGASFVNNQTAQLKLTYHF
ncbi:outer membrane protein [Estrella lausannensis]|uniref:Putative secreted protein n=1 Tax=Estrella lausannensis TaxID=483423 RepID=A0A0H5DNU4_9BACT|nr:porin family protein [Estrella lausannensis]CRX37508.1 putative secreted protein [Estrella lausannensis]